jgi:hypothetical protein
LIEQAQDIVGYDHFFGFIRAAGLVVCSAKKKKKNTIQNNLY